jgi:hypothetical protein
MVDQIKRALTRRRTERNSRVVVEEPDESLVYVVKFGIGMTACLAAVEIASMAFLHTWNSEAFSVITGLIGMITGVFVGRKA